MPSTSNARGDADHGDRSFGAGVGLAHDEQAGDGGGEHRAPVGQAVRSYCSPPSGVVAPSFEGHEHEGDHSDQQQPAGHDRHQAGGRQRLAAAHRPLDADPPQVAADGEHGAAGDGQRASSVRAPAMSNGCTSWRTATPPASRPRAVRMYARNVRSLASVKR